MEQRGAEQPDRERIAPGAGTGPAADGTPRRTVIKGAAWAVPAVMVAASAPLAAASVSDYTLTSNFGVGWYPSRVNTTNAGVLQFDTDSSNKYFYVEGTKPGDVLSDISVALRISTVWPSLTFSALPGSNGQWTVPVDTGEIEVLDGVSYRVYRSAFIGTVTATGSTTHVPIGFYYQAQSPYYSGGLSRVSRYVTVNGVDDLEITRSAANIVNTNVTNPPTP